MLNLVGNFFLAGRFGALCPLVVLNAAQVAPGALDLTAEVFSISSDYCGVRWARRNRRKVARARKARGARRADGTLKSDPSGLAQMLSPYSGFAH